jgi:hypothetical protein
MPVKTDPQCSSKTFITMYQTTWCPNPDCIMNHHHCEHFKSCTKEYKEEVSVDGTVTLGKLNYRKCSMFFKDTGFNTTFFFHQLVNKLRKLDLEHFLITNIISINTHFRVRNFEVLLK